MPHRAKNRHKARHRTHTLKLPNLSLPALPPPDASSLEAAPREALALQPSAQDAQPAPDSEN